jgi:hypothetical protein
LIKTHRNLESLFDSHVRHRVTPFLAWLSLHLDTAPHARIASYIDRDARVRPFPDAGPVRIDLGRIPLPANIDTKTSRLALLLILRV